MILRYISSPSVDNISRSPIAEAVLHDAIYKLGLQNEWRVDSAAIEGWNLGARPDPRALSVLRHHNIEYCSRARRLDLDDFEKFDYILGMDQSNMASLKLLMPHYSNATLLLLSDFLFGFDPNNRAIEDPYYVNIKFISYLIVIYNCICRILARPHLRRYLSSARMRARIF